MRKKLIFIFLTALILFFAYNIIGQIANALKAEERFQDIVETLHKLEIKNKELKAKLEYVKSPEFIETQARDKLGLVKEGETLVIIPDEKIKQILNQDHKSPEVKLPNPLGWWKLFF